MTEPWKQAVEKALEVYGESHVMSPQQVDEVRRDFTRFYQVALAAGLRGIRWNFNDCIQCPEQTGGKRLRRILFVTATIAEATGGRAFGTVVCERHDGPVDDEKVQAALRRIEKEPPEGGS